MGIIENLNGTRLSAQQALNGASEIYAVLESLRKGEDRAVVIEAAEARMQRTGEPFAVACKATSSQFLHLAEIGYGDRTFRDAREAVRNRQNSGIDQSDCVDGEDDDSSCSYA